MKKSILFGLLLAIACMMTTGCSSCQSEKQKQDECVTTALYHDYDGVVQDFTVGVSQVQALHRQTMFALIDGGEYEWRNSRVIFNDTVTAENIDELHVTDINDVFYYWNEQGPWVQFINTNVKNGTQLPWPINDVWIEDDNLSDQVIKLSAEDALQRLKEVNCPIPPAKSMSLRLPVGPCECNPQWVLGDIYDVIFIDAVTGEVTNWNPAFNPKKGVKGGDFGKPLGEWP